MILILGGTGEARRLGKLVAEAGLSGVIAMVGLTQAPAPQALPVRVGGFGGADGFRRYLDENGVTQVIDATHPFATVMTARAHQVCAEAGVPLLRYDRPGWTAGPGDRWTMVPTPESVAAHLRRDARIFLASGPVKAERYGLAGRSVLCRRIDATDAPAPEGWRWVVGRPPFAEADEIALFQREKIDVLVCKNSGGEGARSKLDAARALDLPVVMVDRPALPVGMPHVQTIWAALDWLKAS